MNQSNLHVEGIDWAAWKPTEYANLCFVIANGQILLIRKKRGWGRARSMAQAGRWKKGKPLSRGKFARTQEELGVTPTGLEDIGSLFFFSFLWL